jgi:hypothetical protein
MHHNMEQSNLLKREWGNLSGNGQSTATSYAGDKWAGYGERMVSSSVQLK